MVKNVFLRSGRKSLVDFLLFGLHPLCICASYSSHLLFFVYSSQIWNLKPGWGSRPDIFVENAHSDDISGLKFSSDGRILLSRSFDGSLRVMIYLCLVHIDFHLLGILVWNSLHFSS